MDTATAAAIEETFLALPPGEREVIIRHGVALRLSDLRKRLFLAQSKTRQLEEKYRTTLARLEAEGLPDDAGHEMHEEYILWRHWTETAGKLDADIASLEGIAQHGLRWEEPHASG
ncbi:MAG: hypothetical protein IT369_20680 [Candidatus Latescibacteria bacterium]|nr:hypothetical protein [Candidatus Latescibacterota bacterium]